MNTKKIIPHEGDVVAIPLAGGGFGIGLIVHKGKNKHTFLGYFFDKIYTDIPVQLSKSDFDKSNIALIMKFSSLGIEEGEWPVLKSPMNFIKEEWPIPTFQMQHPITGKYYAVIYDDTLLNERRYEISEEEAACLFGHGLAGYVALENRLTKLLKEV